MVNNRLLPFFALSDGIWQSWRVQSSQESYQYQTTQQTGTTEETNAGSASGTAVNSALAQAAANAAPSAPAGWSIRDVSTSVSAITEEETQARSASGSESTESAAQAAGLAAVVPSVGWDARNVSVSTTEVPGQTGSATGGFIYSSHNAAIQAALAQVPSGAAATTFGANESGGLFNYFVTWAFPSTYSWSATWEDYRDFITGYSWSATWTEYRSTPVYSTVTLTGTRTIYTARWDALDSSSPYTQYRIERDGRSDVVITDLTVNSYRLGTSNYRVRIRAENPITVAVSPWSEYAGG